MRSGVRFRLVFLLSCLGSAACKSASSATARPVADRSIAVAGVAHSLDTVITPIPGACSTPAAERLSEVGCYLTVADTLVELPSGDVFWHLYTFGTMTEAQAERGPGGTATTAFGKVWLYTIGPAAWRPAAGTRVAIIGPLQVTRGLTYVARYMEAVFPYGMQTSGNGHRHSGPEAWYVLTGAQCLETPDRLIMARAGEGALVPQGPAMAISGMGSETRRAVLLVLHPLAEPWSSLAPDWKPKGQCPK